MLHSVCSCSLLFVFLLSSQFYWHIRLKSTAYTLFDPPCICCEQTLAAYSILTVTDRVVCVCVLSLTEKLTRESASTYYVTATPPLIVRLFVFLLWCPNSRYDAIRDAILIRKPTWVSLIYRTGTTTKMWKTEKKLKSKNGYAQK